MINQLNTEISIPLICILSYISAFVGCRQINTDVAGEFARSQNINISYLLDQLLRGYDNHIRPDFGGPPTEVFIDMHVRSMGPISEIDMTFAMDCYFRQMWTDRRLAYTLSAIIPFNDNDTEIPALALSIYMLEKIWKPPTYFLNGKKAYLHTITLPNKFVRIYTDGKVLFSSRMTIKASCPMNLENFPMDTQKCPLILGSFGYSTHDVIYRWNPTRKVVISADMKMSQFDLIATPVSNITNSSKRDGSYSILLAAFHFQRHMGSFVIEVYAPCIMLVVLSWVSFWINREATADRVALGVMTVLTMTFLGLESRNDLPKVHYMTALDYFVALSFAFIFATIIEFAIVHYFTKVGSGEYYFSPAAYMQLDIPNENDNESSDEDDDGAHAVYRVMTAPNRDVESNRDLSDDSDEIENIGQRVIEATKECPFIFHRQQSEIYSTERDRSCVYLRRGNSEPLSSRESETSPIHSHTGTGAYRYGHSSDVPPPPKRAISSLRPNRLSSLRASIRRTFSRSKGKSRRQSVSFQLNSVSQIDRISRVMFPLAFLIINLGYWYWYLKLVSETRLDVQFPIQ